MGSSCSSTVTTDGLESNNAGVQHEAATVKQHESDANTNSSDFKPPEMPQAHTQVHVVQANVDEMASDDVISAKESDIQQSSRQFEQPAFCPQNYETDETTSATASLKLEAGSFTNRLDSPQGDPFSQYDDECDERGRPEGVSVSGLGSRSQSFDSIPPKVSAPNSLVDQRDASDSEAAEKDIVHDGNGTSRRRSWEDVATEGQSTTGVRDDKMAGIGQLAITKPAPEFDTQAVVNGDFKQVKLSDYRGKYVVLFFYPLDFTFVCPTEIIAFSDRVEEFRAIQCEVLACSTDSVYSHLAWVDTPRKQGGLGPMKIPLLADKTLEISKKYGCLKEDEGVAFRGLFIIDDKGNLRQITINDLPVGRSVDETLRLVQAFQFTDKHGEVCPAGWKPGKETMKPSPKESQQYFNKVN